MFVPLQDSVNQPTPSFLVCPPHAVSRKFRSQRSEKKHETSVVHVSSHFYWSSMACSLYSSILIQKHGVNFLYFYFSAFTIIHSLYQSYILAMDEILQNITDSNILYMMLNIVWCDMKHHHFPITFRRNILNPDTLLKQMHKISIWLIMQNSHLPQKPLKHIRF